LYENNVTAIDNAAERQMTHLRQMSSGPRAVAAQDLLNQIAKARIVLLDETKKKQYDEELRQQLEGTAASPTVFAPPSPGAGPSLPTARVGSLPPGRPSSHRRSPPLSTSPMQSRWLPNVAMGILSALLVALLFVAYWLWSDQGGRKPTALQTGGVPPLQSPPALPAPEATSTPHQGNGHETKVAVPEPSSPAPVMPPIEKTPDEAAPAPEPATTPSQAAIPPAGPTSASEPDPNPLLSLPEWVDLPGSIESEPTVIAPLGTATSAMELQVVDRLADKAEAASYSVKQPIPSQGAWEVVLTTAGPDGRPVEQAIGSFVLDAARTALVFRWAGPPDGSQALQQFRNCLMRIIAGGQSRTIALRAPQPAPPLVLNMRDARDTRSFSFAALPRPGSLVLEVTGLTDFPPLDVASGEVRSVAVGQPLVLKLTDVSGAQIEVELTNPAADRLGVSVRPLFRDPDGTVNSMTMQQLNTTLRSLDASIARQQKDIRTLEQALRGMEALERSPQNLSPDARRRDVLLASLRARIQLQRNVLTVRQSELAALQSRSAAGPKIRSLIDALHKRATIAFRILARFDAETSLVLVNSDLSETSLVPNPPSSP
jgi:hypothetical protein